MSADRILNHPAVKNAQAQANHYVGQLDKHLDQYPVLKDIEKKVNFPKVYIVIGVVFLTSLLIFINALAAPISNIIGWALPAYLSFKAIESKDIKDDVQWLTYWVVFGFFNFLESVALSLVLYYIPFYFVFKTIFIIWLQLPATKGARTLYLHVLRPVMINTTGSRPTGPDTDLRAKTAPVTETETH